MPVAFRHAITISLLAALAHSETVSAATINLVGTNSVEVVGQIILGDGSGSRLPFRRAGEAASFSAISPSPILAIFCSHQPPPYS